MKRFLLALMMLALPLAAQEKKEEKPAAPEAPRVQKIFILKYADPRNLSQLLTFFNANLQPNQEMHALAVTASPQAMQAVEDAIARLDVPAAAPKDIVLVMHLVIGSDNDGATAAIPKELDKVVAELRNTFPFKNYRLLDVLTLRTRTGEQASTQSAGGALQFGTVTKPVTSSFSIRSSSVGPDGTTLRLDLLNVNSRIPLEQGPGEFNFWNLDMRTDVDIKEGQQVVIGRQGLNREQALFLVLSAHVVQ